MFRLKRGPNQDQDIARFQDDADQTLSGVNVDGQFFGDARLMTGIILPTLEADNQSAATENAGTIQAAIDSSDPGANIRLPNGKFYCDQINIPTDNPGLTIEGGGRTLLINRAGQANNRVMFSGFANRIADAIGMYNYLPGGANQDSFTAYDIGGGDPDHLAAGDVMYAFIPFDHQTAEHSRYAAMIEITSVQPVGNDVAVTLEDNLPMDLGAWEATATVQNGQVTNISISVNKGGAYYSAFDQNAVHQPRVAIALPPVAGVPAEAKIDLDAPLHKFFITNPGSGYQTTAPTVVFNPSNGYVAHAVVNQQGEVTGIVIDVHGSNFQRSPDVALQGGSGTGAQAVVTIGPSPTLEFDITNPGSNYSPTQLPAVTIDPPLFQAKYVRGGTKVSSISKETVTLSPPERANEDDYPIDSIVWLCNGPAFGDADGQYFRVRATDSVNGIVTLDRTVRAADYRQDLTCLVPGPFIEGLTIRNLKIGGLHPGFPPGISSIILSGVHDLTVENVQMVCGDDDLKPDFLYFTKTQFVRIRNYEGLVNWQTTHNCSIEDSRLTGLVTHSNASDFTIARCRIGGNVRPYFVSERFTFRDCVFAQSGPIEEEQKDDFTATEECTDLVIENCTISSMGWDWLIKVPRFRMSNVRILSGVVNLGSECTDCVLENIRMPNPDSITFAAGSTGRMSNVQPDPGPVNGWFSDTPWLKFPERAVPSAPEMDTAVIFSRELSGKTQLCALFNSGPVQQIAIQPP